MNEHEYDALRQRRRSRRPVSLMEPLPQTRLRAQRRGRPALSPVGAIVAQAASQLNGRQRAAAAWQRIALPVWLPEAWVLGVDGRQPHVVTIGVSSSALLYELRRRQAGLERALASQAPGLRCLRFVPAREDEANDPRRST